MTAPAANAPAAPAPVRVVVFMKEPQPGLVKTRLAVTVGDRRAAELYREFVGTVLEQLQPLRSDGPKGFTLVGYHDGPAEAFASWEGLVDRWLPQPEGDLGVRLATATDADGATLAIGTDCLEIPADLVRGAAARLAEADVVFGPAIDGGYYLVGCRCRTPGLFDGIAWSTPQTLDHQLQRCRSLGLSAGLLEPRHDIDTWEDWCRYRERQPDGLVAGGPAA